MLLIKEPSADLFEKAKNGLLEIKENPSPFDIGSAKKGAEFAAQNFDGYTDYLQANVSENQPQGRIPEKADPCLCRRSLPQETRGRN